MNDLALPNRFHGISFAGRAVSRRLLPARPLIPPLSRKSACLPEQQDDPGERDSDEAVFLCETVRAAGLNPASYRMAPLLRRLPACLRALRVGSIADARAILRAEPAKLATATNALLIGTSSFFRDAAVFHELERNLLPELLSRTPYPKVWSAACSDGLELYSVAMLLASRDALMPDQLLGTDVRPLALQFAAAGVYLSHTVEGVPAKLAEHFLSRERDTVHMAPALRAATRWEFQDLLEEGPPLDSFDMIFCRNLAIYLEGPAVEQLWKRLARTLTAGGILVVGKAEKPRVAGLQRVAPCIYRKLP